MPSPRTMTRVRTAKRILLGIGLFILLAAPRYKGG